MVFLCISWLELIGYISLSLGCGTTWHSAGLLGAIRSSRAHTKLTKYSNELYSDLDKSGYGTGAYILIFRSLPYHQVHCKHDTYVCMYSSTIAY